MHKRGLFKRFLGEAVFDYQYNLLKLDPDWTEPVFGLTDLEFFALQIYTSSHNYFEIVNKALREEKLSPEFDVFIELLNHALDKLPNYEGVCYRGIQIEIDLFSFSNQYKVGSKHCWFAFTSSSPFEEEAYKGNVLFHIDSLTGKNLQFFTADGWNEILFKPKSWYEVFKIDYSDETVVVYLSEIKGDSNGNYS
jgi:hypothetical protein